MREAALTVSPITEKRGHNRETHLISSINSFRNLLFKKIPLKTRTGPIRTGRKALYGTQFSYTTAKTGSEGVCNLVFVTSCPSAISLYHLEPEWAIFNLLTVGKYLYYKHSSWQLLDSCRSFDMSWKFPRQLLLQ